MTEEESYLSFTAFLNEPTRFHFSGNRGDRLTKSTFFVCAGLPRRTCYTVWILAEKL